MTLRRKDRWMWDAGLWVPAKPSIIRPRARGLLPGFCIPQVTGAALDLLAETAAWVAAVVGNGGSVSVDRQILVDELIDGLQTDGIWAKLDCLFLLAAENQPSALTDLVELVLATEVNSPTFTVDTGYNGDGTTEYINSNYNPTTGLGNYTQNSAHLSTWVLTDTADNQASAGLRNNSASDTTDIWARSTGTFYRINDLAEAAATAGSTLVGHHVANRSGATATQAYQNGSLKGSPNTTSAVVINAPFFILCTNQNTPPPFPNFYTQQQVAMMSCGGSLTSTEVGNFYTHLQTYMTAVGL